MKYKAAIYMASYNKDKYVLDALKSIMEQDFKEPYLFIIRENSTNRKTKEIILNYFSRGLEDIQLPENCHWVIQDLGTNDPIGGFNTFVDVSDAEYLFDMHDDDIIKPNWLSSMVLELEKGRDIVHAGWEHLRLNGDVEEYGNPLIYPKEASAVGATELPFLGMRKTAVQRLDKPYHKLFNNAMVGEATAAHNDFIARLQQVADFYPVLDNEDKLMRFVIHRTTDQSNYNKY